MQQSIRRLARLYVGAAMLAIASMSSDAADLPYREPLDSLEGRLNSTSVSADSIEVARMPDGAVFELSVTAADVPRISKIPLGSLIRVRVEDAIHPSRVTQIVAVGVAVGPYPRVIALGASFLVFVLLATAATRGNPVRFMIGLDNRYSNSQSQLVLWFGTLAVIYASTVALRLIYLKSSFIGGVGVTANVIALTGLSAVSFGGAKVITTQKTSLGATPGLSPNIPAQLLVPQKIRAPKPNLFQDLFQNDRGDADFGDFQMILITLAAVGIFASSCFVFLGNLWPDSSIVLPDIDTTLLSAFGVGQGAYLIKKAAMKPGEG